jgi:CspA family cold shock protein
LIAHEGGKQGVFVHVSALNRADLRGLKEGRAVILEIRASRDSQK